MIGKQTAVAVVQSGFQTQGAGGHIDGVVGGADPPLGKPYFLVAIPSFDGQGLARFQFAHDQRDMHLRDRKHHRHGLGLRDVDQAIGIARAHQTAQLDLLQAQPSVDGGGDTGVGKLQLCHVDLRLIGLHRALQLTHQSGLCFYLLTRNSVFAEQVLVALQIQLRIFHECGISGELSLGLVELRFKRSGINFSQYLSSLHQLSFCETQGFEFTIHLGPYDRSVERDQSARGLHGVANIHEAHLTHTHRRAARAFTTAFAWTGTRRFFASHILTT